MLERLKVWARRGGISSDGWPCPTSGSTVSGSTSFHEGACSMADRQEIARFSTPPEQLSRAPFRAAGGWLREACQQALRAAQRHSRVGAAYLDNNIVVGHVS